MLEKAGGQFFEEIKNVLVHDLIMSLSRLTDPARQMGKDNLTLEQLIAKVAEVKEAGLTEALKLRYESIKPLLGPLRDHRKKKIAHFDMGTVLTPETQPLPGLSLGDLRIAIEALENFLSIAYEYYAEGAFSWSGVTTHHDAETLFQRLCMAECYEDTVKSGLISEDRWRNKWDERS
jgi:hypothetical protein